MSVRGALAALLLTLAPHAGALEPTQGILDEIAAYDARLTELDEAEATLRSREATLTAAVEDHRADALTATAEVDRRRANVSRGLHAAYRLQRRGFARLLFDAQSPDELRRRVHYLIASVNAQRAAIGAFRKAVDARAAAAEAAEREMASLTALKAEQAAQREVYRTERARRVALLRAVRESLQLKGQYAAETSTARSDFNASVALHEGSAPASSPGTDAFREARGHLPWPLRGRVAIAWGPYTDPATGQEAQNLGVDVAAPPGTPFRAVFAGTVTRSGYVRGYGQVVMIEHGSYTTLYAHANGLRVAQGQSVAAGDVLGLVGTTGLLDDSQARLHFEVRYNGTPQDPTGWLTPG